MKPFADLVKSLRHDRLLQGVIKNTGYLFSSSTVSMVLGMLQSIFAARLLGVELLGVLGTITSFSSTINRLLSFRMSELVVKYLGHDLTEERRERAKAVVALAAMTEAAASIIAFVVLFLLAPLAAQYLAKDLSFTPLFRIYGLSILAGLVVETSTGILQVDNRFREQAVINVSQSILTAAIILAAFAYQAGLIWVMIAYLLGKIILGIAPVLMAAGSLRKLFGKDWWRFSTSNMPKLNEMMKFAVSTNLSATINLLVRDSELLWISYFLSPLEAGYYKIAMAVVNLVVMPITPFISTTYPEISRSVAAKKWQQLRHLLRRVTWISGMWTAATTLGLLVLGRWVIGLMYGLEYIPAYPALMVLLVGYGLANIFFWNRPLLLALGLPGFPVAAMLVGGLVKVGLAFPLVPRYGYVSEAWLLTSFFVISVVPILWRGLTALRAAENRDPEGAAG
jgi:O-antigen/teichoic acid export membrane protein